MGLNKCHNANFYDVGCSTRKQTDISLHK